MSDIQIVNHVMHVGESHHPWQAPPIERLEVRGHTPSGVRVTPGTLPGVTGRPSQRLLNRPDHLVYCLADDLAWAEAQQARNAWQRALDELAGALRELGRYSDRLAETGKAAPNPLTPTVVHTHLPPDRFYSPTYFWTADVPDLKRWQVERHTPKMVVFGGSPAAQTHCYLCPDDAAWKQIAALREAAQKARQAWADLIKRLGTYAEAREDGRYTTLQSRLAL